MTRMNADVDVTELLEAASRGSAAAVDELFPVLYEELRSLARAQRRRWRGNETVNTTALVHEAYLKLVRQDGVSWSSQHHFFALSAKAMRHILADYARKQVAAKRGGAGLAIKTFVDEHADLAASNAEELVALDEAIDRLNALSERQARIVECRVFVGLSIEETSEALQTSPATVKRDWQLASAWLRRELGDAPGANT